MRIYLIIEEWYSKYEQFNRLDIKDMAFTEKEALQFLDARRILNQDKDRMFSIVEYKSLFNNENKDILED